MGVCAERLEADSFCTTKSVDDSFNRLRDAARNSKSRRLDPKGVWATLRTSPIAGECDRPQVQCTASAAEAASATGSQKPLPKTMFEGSKVDFSIGSDIDTLIGKQDWPSVSGAAWASISCGVLAMEQCDGQAEQLKEGWQALFMIPGVVVKLAAVNQLFWVLRSTPIGVFLWRLGHKQVGGSLAIDFCPPLAGERPWTFASITDYSAWSVVGLRVLPPVASSKISKLLGREVGGMVVVADDIAGPLAEHAARHAFAGMTVFYLSKAYRLLGSRSSGTRPTSELALVRAMVKHLLPRLSDVEVEAIVRLRKSPPSKEPGATVLLDLVSVSSASGVLDEDILKYLEQFQEKHGLAQARSGETAYKSVTRSDKLGRNTKSSRSRVYVSLKGSDPILGERLLATRSEGVRDSKRRSPILSLAGVLPHRRATPPLQQVVGRQRLGGRCAYLCTHTGVGIPH